MTQIKTSHFGTHQDQNVNLFTLSNKNGMSVSVTNYGCIVTSINIPDKQGKIADVVLGFDTLEQYLAGHPFFGAIAGRCASRIAEGKFSIDGKAYHLACNEAATGQHLHGGERGFDKYVWAATIDKEHANSIVFSRTSIDGEEGYPGNVELKHRISLSDDNVLTYDFWAMTDQTTPVNLVNHSYYNLAGHDKDIKGLSLKVAADFITPVSENMIPTGEIHAVANTEHDFREPRIIGSMMQRHPNFDANFILRKRSEPNALMIEAAQLHDEDSGRMMSVWTNQPSIQFYNGFKLSNKTWIGKGGAAYKAFSGLCLETQDFPNSVNIAHFPSILLAPKQIYHRITEHRFSW